MQHLLLTFLRLVHLSLFGVMLLSCSSLGGLTKKKLVFNAEETQQQLQLNLPAGKAEEKYRVGGRNAIEQFYAYEDGSIIYVARHITWPTANQERVRLAETRFKQMPSSFSGTDDKGLYWKEIHVEGFMIGYSEVSPSRVEAFDRALSSVRIR